MLPCSCMSVRHSIASACFVLLPAQALACPLCDNPRGQEVRSVLLSTESIPMLVSILAPFAIAALLLLTINAAMKLLAKPTPPAP